jgi:bifunctional UDP-N-acetylglucosamine pyrophosphorylase/glucosamine-1-phosphate N-acetyltransferase
MTSTPLACVILAGGKGTRMRSQIPKLLHEACGRTLLEWSLAAVVELGADPVVVVVPSGGGDGVGPAVPDWATTAEQAQPRGTGDAARSAQPALDGFSGDVLVLNADHPLTDPESLREMLAAHRGAGAAATVLTLTRTAHIGADFGRIVRDAYGEVSAIVELRDTTSEQRAITEVNSGIYAFQADLLWPALNGLRPENDQGELYLTDAVAALRGQGHRVLGHHHDDPAVALGVNTRADLAEAARLLGARIARRHMLAGVTIVDPATTYIDASVTIEPDVVIHPFTVLAGDTRVAGGAQIGPHAVIAGTTVGRGSTLGPFCYTRPGTVVEDGAQVGRFVEIKNAHIGAGAKVPHLSYIGDAEIGAGSNIGAGAITANYDGVRKQRTVIGRDVHVGSDNVFIAPVTIGDGAWTAAGSAITDDIPPGALGVARARQRNIEEYGQRKRN